MKRISSISIFALLIALGSGVSAKAAPLLSFTSSLTSNNITGFSPNPVSGFSAAFDTFAVSGAPLDNGSYSALNLSDVYSPDVLTVSGSIAGLSGLSSSSTLLTITFSSAGLTSSANGANFDLNFPSNVTAIAVSSVLLADLGLTGSGFSLTALTEHEVNSGFTFEDLPTYFASDPTLTLTATPASLPGATPEPASSVLTMTGLAYIAFMVRKQLVAAS
jgi:hypothetical protein